MPTIEINKIVIIGWDNFTASFIDGIKKYYPNCTIFCTDNENELIKQAKDFRILSPLPSQKYEIYEDADFIIINQNQTDVYSTIVDIQSSLSIGTYIIDFNPVKSKSFYENYELLGKNNPYASCFVFLDEDPSGFTVRSDIFKDQIVAVISDTSTEILQTLRNLWTIVQAKIVPTSADFFDEILAETTQTVSLLSHMYTHILQQDSWADTLFFGFYNKDLKKFLIPTCVKKQYSAENIIANRENIRRMLSLMKKEIDKIDQMIDDEDVFTLSQYFTTSQSFKTRL